MKNLSQAHYYHLSFFLVASWQYPRSCLDQCDIRLTPSNLSADCPLLSDYANIYHKVYSIQHKTQQKISVVKQPIILSFTKIHSQAKYASLIQSRSKSIFNLYWSKWIFFHVHEKPYVGCSKRFLGDFYVVWMFIKDLVGRGIIETYINITIKQRPLNFTQGRCIHNFAVSYKWRILSQCQIIH